MGKPTGSLETGRQTGDKRTVKERIRNYKEFEGSLSPEDLEAQASRCMDCGVPTCHAFGRPVKNKIPDWNDLIYRGQWKRALILLHSTNNFPEFTGRVCSAPCEPANTLSIDGGPVSIRQIEKQIRETRHCHWRRRYGTGLRWHRYPPESNLRNTYLLPGHSAG